MRGLRHGGLTPAARGTRLLRARIAGRLARLTATPTSTAAAAGVAATRGSIRLAPLFTCASGGVVLVTRAHQETLINAFVIEHPEADFRTLDVAAERRAVRV